MIAEYEKRPKKNSSLAAASTALHQKVQQARVLQEQRQFAQAQAICDEMLKANPKQGEALFLSGLIAASTQQAKRAEILFHKATKADPCNANAHYRRGLSQQELGSQKAALESYERAIAINPQLAEAFVDRGNVLRLLNRFEEAIESYNQSIAIRSGYEAYSNRGVVLTHLRQFDAAVESFNRAIAMRPDAAQAYHNRALTRLLYGDFERGFVDHEWRFKLNGSLDSDAQRWFAQRKWLGGPSLRGKSILLHSEQGFGDTIQFCRYVPIVASLGATVILEVQEPLRRLLTQIEGVSRFVTKHTPLERFDYQCALMSLPLAFKTNIDTIPCFPNYLRSDTGKLEQWQRRLGPRSVPRVGLAWSGSRTHANDRNRSVLLAELIPYLPPGFQYVSLQKDIRGHDKKAIGEKHGFVETSQDCEDFNDTAALCNCMDLVISVDTSVAHLSAALGKPTWILLPFNSDWRWLLDRDDSPWYPTAKLYRQQRIGDWMSVFARIWSDLRREFDGAQNR